MSYVSQLLKVTPRPQVDPEPTDLQDYIKFYGEQVTKDAIGDIEEYQNLRLTGHTIGGLPTGFDPLSIRMGRVRPSNTAISVIGEGLIGWYLQQKRGLRPVSRPIGDGPDFIYYDVRTTPARTMLVEVKSTQQASVTQQIRDAAVPLLNYALHLAHSGAPFSCLIAGVIIKSTSDFEILSLELELRGSS